MAEDYIQQLKSVDSHRRREAILALGQSDDPHAPDALRRVARTDPDFELRELAASLLRKPVPAPAEPAPSAPKAVAQPLAAIKPLDIKALDVRPTFGNVREAARKEAKECLTRAFEHRVKSATAEAIGELARGLTLDPGLAADSTALSLAMALTGLPSDQAIPEVIARGKQWNVRRKRTTLGPDAVRFAVEIIVLFLILVLAFTAFSAGFVNAMYKLLNEPSTPAVVATEMGSVFSRLRPADLLLSVPIAFVALILLVFWDSIIYMIGAAVGGTGAALRFLRTLLAVQIVAYVLTILSQSIVVVAVLASVASTISQAQSLAWVSLSLSGLCLAAMVVGQAYFAGRIHGFGFIKGFLCTLFGTIIFGFLWAILGVFALRR